MNPENFNLIDGAWTPVPGMPGAFICAEIRRPDVLSCNSYLLDLPGGRVLMDPGALASQTARLRRKLAGRDGGGWRPLLVMLTHCHYDHSQEVREWLARPEQPAWLAVQEQGALALAAGDARWIAADLYGAFAHPVPTHLLLLAAEDLRTSPSRTCGLSNEIRLQLQAGQKAHGDEPSAWHQTLEFAGGGRIEIVPSPGHTPDSVCYRIGGLLFIGDLLLAHRPLVAGLYGWDNTQRAASLDRVIALLEAGGIQWCCPGHGDPIPSRKALDLLRRQREQAERLDDLAAMDVPRLFQTVEMALELIDEAEEVFSAIEGRLLFLADRLERLEEPAMARHCRDLLDMDGLDARLQAFRDLCGRLDSGALLPVAFANEVTVLLEQIRRLLPIDRLSALLPAAWVGRAERLLMHFIGTAQGLRNLEEYIPVETGWLLADAERRWRSSPHLEEIETECLEDRARFAAELARRIGHPPPSRRIPVQFSRRKESPLVPVAVVRFGDTLIEFLEWLGLAGATALAVAPGPGPDMEIRVEEGMPEDSGRVRSKELSFGRRFILSGFHLVREPRGYRLVHGAPPSPGACEFG